MRWLVTLVVYGIVASACGARTMWYGYSPDRQTRAEVFTQDGRHFVEVNDRHSRPYEAVGTDSLVFSPDGARLAYAARQGDGWVLVVDGRASRPWDGIGEIVFSPDGRRVAYAAEQRGRWRLVVDGVGGPPVGAILRESVRFSPDGQRLAYVVQYADGVHAVIDGVASARYDGIGRLTFSGDGRRVGFLARMGESAYAVIDGDISPAYRRIDDLAFGPAGDAGYVAERTDGQVAVIGAEVSQPHRRVTALRPGPRPGDWAYIAQKMDRSWSVIRADEASRSYDAIDPDSLRFAPDGRAFAFAGARAGRWFAVIGAREMGPYEAVEPAHFAARGRAWGVIAHDAEGSVVIGGDGIAGKRSETRVGWAGSLRLSVDGTRRAYLATDGARRSVVVDGARFDFELVVDGSLLFSRDGEHWACLAAIDRSGRFWLIIDGRPRKPFDLVEVMYWMAGDPYQAMLDPATDRRIQAIVAAELERDIAGAGSGRVPSDGRLPVIDFAARQPTPARYRFAPARALALSTSLGFVTGPGSILASEGIRLTDLVLWRGSTHYALSSRSHVFAGATLVPKQPHGATEMAWQEVQVGAAMAPLSTRMPGLSVNGELTGGPLLTRAGWWARAGVDIELRRRLTEALSARVSTGVDSTWLALGDGDEHVVLGSARAYSGLVMHQPRSRIAGWLGTELWLPLVASQAVADPLTGAPLAPARRLAVDAGLALSVDHRFQLFIQVHAIRPGAAPEAGASLPVLSDIPGYRLVLGASRRFGAGAMSPALVVQ